MRSSVAQRDQGRDLNRPSNRFSGWGTLEHAGRATSHFLDLFSPARVMFHHRRRTRSLHARGSDLTARTCQRAPEGIGDDPLRAIWIDHARGRVVADSLAIWVLGCLTSPTLRRAPDVRQGVAFTQSC